jgi:hypothetical protein
MILLELMMLNLADLPRGHQSALFIQKLHRLNLGMLAMKLHVTTK